MARPLWAAALAPRLVVGLLVPLFAPPLPFWVGKLRGPYVVVLLLVPLIENVLYRRAGRVAQPYRVIVAVARLAVVRLLGVAFSRPRLPKYRHKRNLDGPLLIGPLCLVVGLWAFLC